MKPNNLRIELSRLILEKIKDLMFKFLLFFRKEDFLNKRSFMNLAGSKTEQNLLKSFAGESQEIGRAHV